MFLQSYFFSTFKHKCKKIHRNFDTLENEIYLAPIIPQNMTPAVKNSYYC